MPIAPGARLGSYEVLAPIGAGDIDFRVQGKLKTEIAAIWKAAD